ncbi:hypothetical protein FOZ60_010306 [Perkinsus olseni]|uniref:Uncharacterized protein n=1 Tax=Perkinsus olseni TaxID=32597 RepID=A0A7J6NFE1_PEROL|nr:hypothetical protein FOZ60_010306 [Perkinsus olseni]
MVSRQFNTSIRRPSAESVLLQHPGKTAHCSYVSSSAATNGYRALDVFVTENNTVKTRHIWCPRNPHRKTFTASYEGYSGLRMHMPDYPFPPLFEFRRDPPYGKGLDPLRR